MSPPWDVLGVGMAIGGTAGIFAGYQLRKLVVHIQEYRAYRTTKREVKVAYEHDQVAAIVKREKPMIIPLKARRFVDSGNFKEKQSLPVINPDRDDVIAALMGAGYKKSDAEKAADACSMVERAHGLEAWTVAALRNAHGGKS